MKMYHYNPHNYGSEYFILAENKIKSYEYLLKYFENEIITDEYNRKFHQRHLDMWEKVNPMDETTFPDEYTLDEHEVGSVIKSEIA